MRRIMLALLVSTVTAVATLAPPVTAQGAVPGRDAFTATFAHLARQARLKASAKAPRRNLAAVATHHVLAMDAAASRVSINRLRAEWQLVAICEVGGNWSMIGSAYSGIGFLNTTWAQYGGTSTLPWPVSNIHGSADPRRHEGDARLVRPVRSFIGRLVGTHHRWDLPLS